MPRKKTPAQAKKAALESDYTPLYAVAGLTDALADALRSALVERQERARRSLTELTNRGPVLQRQARTNADELREFVITLPEQFKHLPEATKARVNELQTQANELIAQATATYSELAGRGKLVVDGAVGTARGLADRTEDRVEDLREEAGERVDPLLEQAQESVTRARKTVSGRTATETVTPRSAAKSAATRKAGAAKKAAVEGEVIKKAAADRARPPKKSTPAKKTAAPVKKAAAKKTPDPQGPGMEPVATGNAAGNGASNGETARVGETPVSSDTSTS